MGFFQNIRGPELLIILLIIVLLFGAKKLPDTARGLGRSLRIFKAETKGLTDDENASASSAPVQAPQPQAAPQPPAPQQIAAAPQQPPATSGDPASQPAPSTADERS
jgi:sec-independent protein translocase protein TatA